MAVQTPQVGKSAFDIIPLGAIIQRFSVAGHNIVLGFPEAEAYENNTQHFGATIGRVANRLKDAKIDNLNGKSYQLVPNNGPNSLHGGPKGWGKQPWTGPTKEKAEDLDSTRYVYHSADGDQGFPGAVDASVVYTESTEAGPGGVDKTVLTFDLEATLAAKQPDGFEETAINMTNHSYFNITGQDTIEGTEATLPTNLYLPLDNTGIPTKGPTSHESIPANKKFTIGATEPDPDDCFVLDPNAGNIPLDTRKRPLRTLATFYHPTTKIHLEILSTEPAFQFYTGKYIDVPAQGGAPARKARAGFCVEPSRYVNAINVDEWRDQVLLKKGGVYGSRIVYKAWKD